MPSIEELRARFQRDRFATELTGADIREAEPGRAVCALSLRPVHLNANGVPMGGGRLHPGGLRLRGGGQRLCGAGHRIPARVRHLPLPRQGPGAAGGGQVPEGGAGHLPVPGRGPRRAGNLRGPRGGKRLHPPPVGGRRPAPGGVTLHFPGFAPFPRKKDCNFSQHDIY